MIDLDLFTLLGGNPVSQPINFDSGILPPIFRKKFKNQPRKREKTLKGVVPNAGIEAMYSKSLLRLVDAMTASVRRFIVASYRANPPELAHDELAPEALKAAIAKLVKRWYRNFDEAAKKLAEYFAKKVSLRTEAALKKILKDGGFSIEFQLSRAQREVLGAIVQENVSLIKSIPRQMLPEVEQMVMRSITAGRDLKGLQDELTTRFNITRRRAELIARDQNNKATGALHRVRQLEIAGDQAEAIWVHSGNHQNARKTHLRAGNERTRFRVLDGWYDPAVGKKIHPGELINCRCFSRLIIPGVD